jgi:benzoyl-CoA reductase/2-hydroxyglutaryl-CoA dehydratase subunit BcrC/BadD/HgdB
MSIKEMLRVSETLSNSYIEDWKLQRKKVLGYYCTDIPEEILHAGNILGYRMRGTEAEGSGRADTIMNRFNCSFVRATLDLIMQGKYGFLDGLCISNSCDHVRRIYDVYQHRIMGIIDGIKRDYPLFFLSTPHILTDRGYRWLREEYEIFKTSLEDRFKIDINNEDLKKSIKVLNKSRNLLKEIHALRILEQPKITGAEALQINIANTSTPKEIFNQELENYIKVLKDKDGISDYRARLLVTGSIIDDPQVLKIFEDVGGIVASDVACFGTRNFWDLTSEEGDPLDAITNRYYNKISCPRMMDDDDRRFEFLKDRIKEAKIDGVIGIRIEFCDLNGCENMILEHKLKDLGVPFLSVDRDYFMGDINRFQNRIEAFIEQIT